MKKCFSALLCVALVLSLFAGCDKQPEFVNALQLSADNDIITYEKLETGKTTLVVAVIGNIFVTPLIEAYEAANPDVQVIVIDITGGNDFSNPYKDWLDKGVLPDIVISGGKFIGEKAPSWFVDLSGKTYIDDFNTESLNRVSVDGKIYMLPGPSSIGAIMYNKDMFKAHGWEVPKNFDEFVALCKQINEETNGEIQAWNPNAKYSAEIITAMEGFTYGDILEGVDNYSWYLEFLKGESSFAEHMQPLYDAWQKLVDAKVVNEGHFTYSATTRGEEFNDGKIAMVNMSNITSQSGNFEVGFMPFFGAQDGSGYVVDTLSCLLGMTKNEGRSAEVSDAAERFLGFYSSKEGQLGFIEGSFVISNVNGVESESLSSLSELLPYIQGGKMFELAGFAGPGTGSIFSPITILHEDFLAILKGEKTAAESMARMDSENASALAGEYETVLDIVATASENFTSLEVSNFFADMYREKAGADIGLIVHGNAYRGNLMRIFAGDINTADVGVMKPRSLANESRLIKVSMTGKQLLDALNAPVGNEMTADAIYAFSGLKATVAPWKPLGEKYLMVTLESGMKIDMKETYSVACWEGTIADEYITEVLETYNGTFEDLLTETLKAKGTIAPAKDGRITLSWE